MSLSSALGAQSERYRQSTAKRLDQTPIAVRLVELAQSRNQPAFAAGPFEGRTDGIRRATVPPEMV
jgi:hypothetical protein